MSHVVLLTGATGFLGKVVLEELLRRREELAIAQIYCVIRDKAGAPAAARLDFEIKSSACFSKLPHTCWAGVTAVSGDLAQEKLGITDERYQALSKQVNIVINCAASIDFNLPIAHAASANIATALGVLAFAQSCQHLHKMTHISTAYVTPFIPGQGQIKEQLVPLVRNAAEVYEDILTERLSEDALLNEFAHPNTYTLTKCLAEHLLEQNKKEVPLCIVRPSIINGSLQYPMPGWTDSFAALSGFLVSIGAGYLKTVRGGRNCLSDVVPVDYVAECILFSAFKHQYPDDSYQTKPAQIYHAVAGNANTYRNELWPIVGAEYFRQFPVVLPVSSAVMIENKAIFNFYHTKNDILPGYVRYIMLRLLGKPKMAAKHLRAFRKMQALNKVFPYFTINQFNFQKTIPCVLADLKAQDYMLSSMKGVYQYLFKRTDTEVCIAGKNYRGGNLSLKEIAFGRRGTVVMRVGAALLHAMSKRCFKKVTYNHQEFSQIKNNLHEQAINVIIPTHRSYVDFLACSYLFYRTPELGIDIPYIAAAHEFSKIPILGSLFKKCRAFYIKRGEDKRCPELTRRVHQLAENKQTLEFFIEGKRSRSGMFLDPKRGLLRCLIETGKPLNIIPVAISFEQVPELKVLLNEVSGGTKSKMTLSGLLRWCGSMMRGNVNCGAVHMTVGKPIYVESTSDVKAISREIVGRLQEKTVITTHHLRAFIARCQSTTISVEWLKEMIEARGGVVQETTLTMPADLLPEHEQWLRNHWQHWFYAEALRLFPENLAIRDHCDRNGYMSPQPAQLVSEDDDALLDLLKPLLRPICEDYVTVARAILELKLFTLQDLKQINPAVYLPYAEQAIALFIECRVVQFNEMNSHYLCLADPETVQNYLDKCRWQEACMPADATSVAEPVMETVDA